MSAAGQYYESARESDAVRETLVLQHLPQVRTIARRIHNRLPQHISLDDLISAGIVGLLEAIDHFDYSMNIQLNTFAERRIHGAILDSLRQMDSASRDVRRKAKTVEAAIHRAKQRLCREPEEEEIAKDLSISISEYHDWLTDIQAIELAPLEFVSRGGEESTLLRVIPDDEERSPEQLLERSELERVLAKAIERMPKIERTVLNLYYYEELTLAEISRVIGLHLSRAAQLRIQGVLRLRSHLQRVWPDRRKQ